MNASPALLFKKLLQGPSAILGVRIHVFESIEKVPDNFAFVFDFQNAETPLHACREAIERYMEKTGEMPEWLVLSFDENFEIAHRYLARIHPAVT